MRQGMHHLFDSWCRSPTGDFCPDKSHQKPLRGHPLRSPFEHKEGFPYLLFGTPSRKRAAYAPLARYIIVNDNLLPLHRCALQLQRSSGACTPIRHSETKAQIAIKHRRSGRAGQMLRRFNEKVPKIDMPQTVFSRGYIRGYPLMWRFGDFLDQGESHPPEAGHGIE